LNDKALQVANVPAASLRRLSQALNPSSGIGGATAANWRKPSKIAQVRASTAMALNANFQFAVEWAWVERLCCGFSGRSQNP
jgi:hypothetical protein